MRNFFVAACSLALAGGCSIQQFEHARSEQKTIEPEQLQIIDLTTFNGSVDVEAHNSKNVQLEMKFSARGDSDAAAKNNCESLGCDVTEADGKLTIVATKPTDVRSASVSIRLHVPADCNLKLATSNGAISVSDIAADVDCRTSNGAVRCERLQGDLAADTSNGAIDVSASSCSIRLTTSNGRVSYSGRVLGEENEIATTNGSVSVAVPADETIEIVAATSNGRIRADLPERESIEVSRNSLHAVFGDKPGDDVKSKLSVRTSNGSVTIEACRGAIPAEELTPEKAEAELPAESDSAER